MVFFVRRLKQHSERLFCVLCFDNKPREDRRAQSRCCLRLGKEGVCDLTVVFGNHPPPL